MALAGALQQKKPPSSGCSGDGHARSPGGERRDRHRP